MGVRDLTRVGARVGARLARLEKRAEAQAKQLARQRGRLDKQGATLERQAGRVKRQSERLERQARLLEAYNEQVALTLSRATRAASLAEVVGSQVAALEVRLADLEERLAAATPAPPVDLEGPEADEARGLLAEVRTEHARIRQRFGVVAAFEERLRRVEEAVADDAERTLEEFVETARRLAQELGPVRYETTSDAVADDVEASADAESRSE